MIHSPESSGHKGKYNGKKLRVFDFFNILIGKQFELSVSCRRTRKIILFYRKKGEFKKTV